MNNIFYQANFCAECGNPLEPRHGLRPRYFCDDCGARISRRGYFTPFSLLLGLLTIWYVLNDRHPASSTSNSINQTDLMTASPTVSAWDASPKQHPQFKTDTEERVFCGARTKKGTPCRHRVRPGQRCAQHRGMPSLLESKRDSNSLR